MNFETKVFPNNFRQLIKKRIFYGQADRKRRPPLPPLQLAFCDFFGVLLTLYYDYMSSEAYFTQEKVDFHATTEIPNSSSYCCCPPDDNLQVSGPSGSSFAKGRPLRMTICKRPVPSDHCLQEAGPSF